MCFIYTCNFTTTEGNFNIDNIKIGQSLLDLSGNNYKILHIYKLPEFKLIKMVRILQNAFGNQIPSKTTYLKPTQYVKYNGSIIKASQLVDMRLAEYEKINTFHFYLINVEPIDNSDKTINEYVLCNGLEVSVYNKRHPLNNRFGKFKLID